MSLWYDDQGRRRSKPFGFDTDTTAKQAKARFDFWMLTFRQRPDIRSPEGKDALFTIPVLCGHYLRYARKTFRKDGKPTSHVWNVRLTMRALRDAYRDRTVASIDLKDIVAFRDSMIEGKSQKGFPVKRAMKTVNTRLGIVKSAFRWAAQRGEIPATVAGAVMLAEPLKLSRSDAKNPRKVKPVHTSYVEQTLPHLPPILQDMVKFLDLQGCRPEEACSMRVGEIEIQGDLWLYRPRHKMEHLEGIGETIRFIGPKAQEILRKHLSTNLSDYVFSPSKAHAQRLEQRRNDRASGKLKTPLFPSHAKRKVTGPSRRVGDHYETATLRRAIHYACKKAGIAKWNPNQLRHAVATRLRQQYGSELGMQFTGHKHLSTFEIYAEKNAQAAMRIAREVG
jgi:integrase